jgi:hypothetical protein
VEFFILGYLLTKRKGLFNRIIAKKMDKVEDKSIKNQEEKK